MIKRRKKNKKLKEIWNIFQLTKEKTRAKTSNLKKRIDYPSGA
jgi:hypothetical protein